MKINYFSRINMKSKGWWMLLFYCTMPFFAFTQNYFEGSITYSIALSGDDATVIMENNPPKKMDMHIKNDNFIIQLYESRVPRTFLFIGDSSHTFGIDAGSKIYYLRDYYRDTSGFIPKAVLVKDSAEFKGIRCQIYKAKFPDMVVEYYVSAEYRIDTSWYTGKEEAKADFLTPGLGGMIPLKKVIREKTLTTTLEYTKIEARHLPIENFRIPEGYQRKKRDHRM